MAQRGAGGGDRRSHWRGLIEQWESSGATQEVFCGARGVSVASLRWWKWKLGVEEAGEPRSRRRPDAAVAVAVPARPAFVPVRIVERGAPSGGSSPAGAFELTLPGGVRLRVPRDFEAESLARLLAVLGEGRAC